MKKRSPKVSVVIPTFNEEKNLPIVLKNLPKDIHEIIVVDKHSEDKTANIAKGFGANVILDKGGKGTALIKGMKAATGDIIITMDADCSHKESEIGLLIEGIGAGYDICMGSRFIQGGGTEDMPYYRKLGNKFFVFLVNFLYNTSYSDLCYGYRSIKRGCINKLGLKSDGFGIETEISIKAAKKGLKTLEIPSFEKIRKEGEGKLKTFKDGFEILKIILKSLVK